MTRDRVEVQAGAGASRSLERWTLLYIGFLLAVMAVADAGLGKPLFRLARLVPFEDRGAHFLLFGLLAWLLARVRPGRVVARLGLELATSSWLLLLVVTGEEWLQALLPHRTADPLDLLADLLGILLFDRLARLRHPAPGAVAASPETSR